MLSSSEHLSKRGDEVGRRSRKQNGSVKVTARDKPGTKVKATLNLLSLLNRRNYTTFYGGVAQLGEHLPCKQGVMGSNPIISTIVTNKEIKFVTNKAGFEGEAAQSKLPVDVCDRGRPSA